MLFELEHIVDLDDRLKDVRFRYNLDAPEVETAEITIEESIRRLQANTPPVFLSYLHRVGHRGLQEKVKEWDRIANEEKERRLSQVYTMWLKEKPAQMIQHFERGLIWLAHEIPEVVICDRPSTAELRFMALSHREGDSDDERQRRYRRRALELMRASGWWKQSWKIEVLEHLTGHERCGIVLLPPTFIEQLFAIICGLDWELIVLSDETHHENDGNIDNRPIRSQLHSQTDEEEEEDYMVYEEFDDFEYDDDEEADEYYMVYEGFDDNDEYREGHM